MSGSAASPPLPPGYLEQYYGNNLIGFTAAFMAIEVIFVGLRFLARRISKTRVGVDDYLIIPALVSCLLICALTLAMVVEGGIGWHIQVVLQTPEKVVMFSKLQVPFTIAYLLGITFPKLAIIYLYLRVFVRHSHRFICYILIGALSANCFACVLVTLLECMPLAFLWDPTIPGGHCIDTLAFWRWASLSNIVTDVVMLGLPLPVIWQIQLSKKDKIGLVLTFCTGSIGLITSILRFISFFTTDFDLDPSWDAATLAMYSISEPGVYLIAACLPTYRSLYLTIRKRNPLSRLDTTRGSKTGRETHGDSHIQLSSIQGQKASYGNSAMAGFKRLEGDEKYLVHAVDVEQDHSRPESLEAGTMGESGIQVRHDYYVSNPK